ncbi:MAG: Gfo/Idh/MocA family oxidoreductase [Bacteroidales bacterium]
MEKTGIIRFGIVGTNFISDWVITGGSQDTRFRAAAVCSRSEETGKTFADKHHIPHIFTSPEEMAASGTIDAVYIASPNALHCPLSLLFMKYGIHVLCEKPLASNLHEADAMMRAARKHKVVLMEAMKPTLTPNFKQVIKNLPRIGKVRNYFSSYCQYSSRYDKFKEGIILNAFRPELSNGALMDIGVYTIYPMVVLFGKPNRIQASGVLLSTGADGCGSVIFEYEDMRAEIIYSKIADSYLPTEIQGEEGTLTLDRINTISTVSYRARGSEAPEDLSLIRDKDEYYYEVAAFIDTIVNDERESAINSLTNSRIVMEVLDEIRRQLGVVYPADL